MTFMEMIALTEYRRLVFRSAREILLMVKIL